METNWFLLADRRRERGGHLRPLEGRAALWVDGPSVCVCVQCWLAAILDVSVFVWSIFLWETSCVCVVGMTDNSKYVCVFVHILGY